MRSDSSFELWRNDVRLWTFPSMVRMMWFRDWKDLLDAEELHRTERFRFSPALASQGNVEFNMTHSGGFAVIAATLDREVGVDVEQIRAMPAEEDAHDTRSKHSIG